jgi:N6-adenosine-specific RNA methylase IME4
VTLMGDVPRVELFARKRYRGWEAWGNEVEEGEANDCALW